MVVSHFPWFYRRSNNAFCEALFRRNDFMGILQLKKYPYILIVFGKLTYEWNFYNNAVLEWLKRRRKSDNSLIRENYSEP